MTEKENEILANVLKNMLKPMSEEEREKQRKEQYEKEEYLKRVKQRFLNYARSLPGKEDETPNEILFKIKGEIKNNKIINLKAYTWLSYVEEEMAKIFNSSFEEKYFTIDINGNVEIKSDDFPDEILEITKNILQDDGTINEKEVSNGKNK